MISVSKVRTWFNMKLYLGNSDDGFYKIDENARGREG